MYILKKQNPMIINVDREPYRKNSAQCNNCLPCAVRGTKQYIFLTTLYFLKPIYNIHELLTIAILIKTNVTPGLINESPAPAITKIKNPKDKNKKFRLII